MPSFFEGEQQIKAEELSEASEQYREVKGRANAKGLERFRDVKMQCE